MGPPDPSRDLLSGIFNSCGVRDQHVREAAGSGMGPPVGSDPSCPWSNHGAGRRIGGMEGGEPWAQESRAPSRGFRGWDRHRSLYFPIRKKN